MKRFFCTYQRMARGSYTPPVDEVLKKQPKPCKLYREHHLMRWVLELEDGAKPVDFVLAGISWEAE